MKIFDNTTNRPKVSVCVPTHNAEQYIERCIESLIKQTLKDIEIVIVDDCSSDHTVERIYAYTECDRRVKLITSTSNDGAMYARMVGYKAATGDYITFCDSDDEMPKNAIELLYQNAIRHCADIVSGNMLYKHHDGHDTIITSELKYGSDSEAVYKSMLCREFRHNLCSKLFKRELLQIFPYQTFKHFSHGEDGFLFYQIVGNTHKTIQIDEIVYIYYQNLTSSSNVRLTNWALECVIMGNSMRDQTCSKYPKLEQDLRACILNVMATLYRNNYNEDGTLKYLIDKYKLTDYISTENILKCAHSRLTIKALYFIKVKPLLQW